MRADRLTSEQAALAAAWWPFCERWIARKQARRPDPLGHVPDAAVDGLLDAVRGLRPPARGLSMRFLRRCLDRRLFYACRKACWRNRLLPRELAVTLEEQVDAGCAGAERRCDAADWWSVRRTRLPGPQRGLIEAYYFAGQTDAEVSARYGLGSARRAKGRRHVALARLRDMDG